MSLLSPSQVILGRIENRARAAYAAGYDTPYQRAVRDYDLGVLREAYVMVRDRFADGRTVKHPVVASMSPDRDDRMLRSCREALGIEPACEPVFHASLAAWDSWRGNDEIGFLDEDDSERMSPFDRDLAYCRDHALGIDAEYAVYMKHAQGGYVLSTQYGPRLLFCIKLVETSNDRRFITFEMRELHSNEREQNTATHVMHQDDLDDVTWSKPVSCIRAHEPLVLDGGPEDDVRAGALVRARLEAPVLEVIAVEQAWGFGARLREAEAKAAVRAERDRFEALDEQVKHSQDITFRAVSQDVTLRDGDELVTSRDGSQYAKRTADPQVIKNHLATLRTRPSRGSQIPGVQPIPAPAPPTVQVVRSYTLKACEKRSRREPLTAAELMAFGLSRGSLRTLVRR